MTDTPKVRRRPNKDRALVRRCKRLGIGRAEMVARLLSHGRQPGESRMGQALRETHWLLLVDEVYGPDKGAP